MTREAVYGAFAFLGIGIVFLIAISLDTYHRLGKVFRHFDELQERHDALLKRSVVSIRKGATRRPR